MPKKNKPPYITPRACFKKAAVRRETEEEGKARRNLSVEEYYGIPLRVIHNRSK